MNTYYMTPGGQIVDSAPFPHRTWRPVVVIDPEDREQVAQFVEAVEAAYAADDKDAAPGYDVTIYQRALRSLIAPPKPEEPTGLGAVVEDSQGRSWVRVFGGEAHPGLADTDGPWKLAYAVTGRRLWENLPAVRVLSEGIS